MKTNNVFKAMHGQKKPNQRFGLLPLLCMGGESQIRDLDSRHKKVTSIAVATALSLSLGVSAFASTPTSDYGAIVCTGANYADALSASTLSDATDLPIYMVSDDYATKTRDAMKADGVTGKIYVIGGTNTVSDDAVKTLGYEYTRLSGETRYETNYLVQKEAGKYDEHNYVTLDDFSEYTENQTNIDEAQNGYLETLNSKVTLLETKFDALIDELSTDIENLKNQVSLVAENTITDIKNDITALGERIGILENSLQEETENTDDETENTDDETVENENCGNKYSVKLCGARTNSNNPVYLYYTVSEVERTETSVTAKSVQYRADKSNLANHWLLATDNYYPINYINKSFLRNENCYAVIVANENSLQEGTHICETASDYSTVISSLGLTDSYLYENVGNVSLLVVELTPNVAEYRVYSNTDGSYYTACTVYYTKGYTAVEDDIINSPT